MSEERRTQDLYNHAIEVIDKNNERHKGIVALLVWGWMGTAATLGFFVAYCLLRLLAG